MPKRKLQLPLMDQGYENLPQQKTSMIPEKMPKRTVPKTSECYNMSHRNRGTCLVFNHEVFETKVSDRRGSRIDVNRIEATFTELGFQVVIHVDLDYSGVMREIKSLSGANHADNDCVCIFVLTHGLNNDLLMTKDAIYAADKIWQPFTAEKCPTLAGKPKLFFFEASRGETSDHGITLLQGSSNCQSDSVVASYTIPSHSDFLIAHSCAKGFCSWRNPREGTPYIQSLCDVFHKYSQSRDLLRMLTMTARIVGTNFQFYDSFSSRINFQAQVPTITSTLIRDLYLTSK